MRTTAYCIQIFLDCCNNFASLLEENLKNFLIDFTGWRINKLDRLRQRRFGWFARCNFLNRLADTRLRWVEGGIDCSQCVFTLLGRFTVSDKFGFLFKLLHSLAQLLARSSRFRLLFPVFVETLHFLFGNIDVTCRNR